MNVATGADHAPLWSVMIPVHNCADLLRRTLPQVVDQLGGRTDVEILVLDDGSADDPAAVVEQIGAGAVRYLPSPTRLGAVRNFNRCLSLAQGELVHILHGDDAVLDGFYPTMEQAADRHHDAVAFMCRSAIIDADDRQLTVTRRYRRGTGKWDQARRAVAVSNRVRAPSIVVRRSAYQAVGGFRTDLPHAADWDMWVRLSTHGPLVFVDEVLAHYRRHAGSDTAARIRTGANIRERITAIGIVMRHVPERERALLSRVALLYSTVFASRTAAGLARSRDWAGATIQTREAIRCLVQIPRGVAAEQD